MTQYYARVEKDTGLMAHGHTNYTDEPDYPVNEDELALVPLSDEIAKMLVSQDPADHEGLQTADWTKTRYDFSTESWVMVYQTVEIIDHAANKEDERQDRLSEANRLLKIVDLPNALKKQINDYIIQLQSIKIDPNNPRDTIFPLLPF